MFDIQFETLRVLLLAHDPYSSISRIFAAMAFLVIGVFLAHKVISCVRSRPSATATGESQQTPARTKRSKGKGIKGKKTAGKKCKVKRAAKPPMQDTTTGNTSLATSVRLLVKNTAFWVGASVVAMLDYIMRHVYRVLQVPAERHEQAPAVQVPCAPPRLILYLFSARRGATGPELLVLQCTRQTGLRASPPCSRPETTGQRQAGRQAQPTPHYSHDRPPQGMQTLAPHRYPQQPGKQLCVRAFVSMEPGWWYVSQVCDTVP